MRGMTILVTGGSGYIGSHTCVELLEAGYDVVVVDNFLNSDSQSIKRVTDITGKEIKTYSLDVSDRVALENVFAENSIEAVIHFAGLKAAGESVKLPLKYYRNNLLSTITLCEVMEKFGVYQLVFSSSATVYGEPEQMPIREDYPLRAVNPYGRTKIMLEEILRDLCQANQNWCIAALRYFNPTGAHKSGLIGEGPKGIPNNLMPYITQVAVGKLSKLPINGNDYPTEDGTCIRDYLHVVDLANGHVKALDNLRHSPGMEAYNLGTGNGYSVFEVVKAFEQATGLTIPYEITDRRPGDAPVSFADPKKSRARVGLDGEKGNCRDV